MKSIPWTARKDELISQELRRLLIKNRGNIYRASKDLQVEPGFFRSLIKRHKLELFLKDVRGETPF